MNELKNKCLMCFTQTQDLIKIFSRRGRSLKIVEIITRHFWFEVSAAVSICVRHNIDLLFSQHLFISDQRKGNSFDKYLQRMLGQDQQLPYILL